MEDLLKNISKYDFFVYLVPGCLMVVATKVLCGVNLLLDNVVIDCLAIYSYGIVSEIIGANTFVLFEKLKIVEYVTDEDYSIDSKETSKASAVSRRLNIYRSIVGAMVCSIIIACYNRYLSKLDRDNLILILISIILIIIIIASVKYQLAHMNKTNKSKKKVKNW